MSIKKYLKENKRGSALLMTMFILSSIMIIAFGGSLTILSGIKMSGVQSQSIKAYFAAESGIERILYEVRKGSFDLSPEFGANVFITPTVLGNNSSYIVDYNSYNPKIIFTSTGSYLFTKRSVEVTF